MNEIYKNEIQNKLEENKSKCVQIINSSINFESIKKKEKNLKVIFKHLFILLIDNL